MSARNLLIIFAKAPVAGEVNTRLIPDIGVEAATQLQQDLIAHRMQQFAAATEFDVQLWCAPDTQHPVFQQCAREHGIDIHQQQGVDLGARMQHAIATGLASYQYVALIGTDAPSLEPATVTQTFAELVEHEVVIVPAEDGGYVLIAMRAMYDKVFLSVPWGSSRVLTRTRGNIVAQALKYKELATSWDVDTLEDYQRYLKMKNLLSTDERR